MKTEAKAIKQAAQIDLVLAFLKSGEAEVRGEHCSGGALRPSLGETGRDPAEYDLRLPTTEEVLAEIDQCSGDNDIETALMAVGAATLRIMWDEFPDDLRISAGEDVAWSVCGRRGMRIDADTVLDWISGE